MAIATKTQLSRSDESGAVGFFNSLNCPLISASLVDNYSVININNVFEIKKIASDNGIEIYKNGTSIASLSRGYTSPYITIVYGTNFVFIWICSSNSSWYSSSCGVIYKKVGEKELYGFYSGSGLTTNIVNFPLIENTTNIEYRINTVFKDYSPDINYLDYTQACLFQGQTKLPDERVTDFYDCSTVTIFSVVSFNGTNYFAIGTHTLVKLDN